MDDIFQLGDFLLGIFKSLIEIGFAFILLAFFWGLALFVKHTGSADAKGLEQWRNWLFWSVIALFVSLSLYGIIDFLQDSADVGSLIIPPLGI